MDSIALWSGHESLETTHVYVQTDLLVKERALAKLDPVKGTMTRFKAADPLLARGHFLRRDHHADW